MLQGRCPAALGPGHVPLWPTPMRHSARCRLLGLAPHRLDPHRARGGRGRPRECQTAGEPLLLASHLDGRPLGEWWEGVSKAGAWTPVTRSRMFCWITMCRLTAPIPSARIVRSAGRVSRSGGLSGVLRSNTSGIALALDRRQRTPEMAGENTGKGHA